MTIQSLSTELEALIRWFLFEIADQPRPLEPDAALGAPTPGPEDLSYALATLAGPLGFSPDALYERLSSELAASPNADALRTARDARRQRRFEPYELSLNDCDARPRRFRLCPRPIGNTTTAVLEHLPQAASDKYELRYRVAVDAAKIGVWEWDIASDRLVLGHGYAPMLGYSPDELPKTMTAAYEFIHPEDHAGLRRLIAATLETRASHFEYVCRLLDKNGTSVWILTRGQTLGDEKGAIIGATGVGLNVTEIKIAQQAIETERCRLFTLLDRLPALIFLLAPDYSFRFANRQFTEELGSTQGRPCYSLLNKTSPCEICPALETLDTQALAVWEQEIPSIKKTYQLYGYPFADVDGTPLALVVGFDITRNKLAQEALRASEERYRSITDNLSLGIAVVGRDLRVQAVNPKIREWFPKLDPETRPHCYTAFISQDRIVPCEECPLLLTFADGGVHEITRQAPCLGGVKSLRTTYCPMFDSQGEVAAAIALVEDVTEREQVQARLARAQRLEALGTLAGGIAHEINQPLNALQLYVSGLEMLVEKNPALDPQTLLTRLSWILNESGKIRDIITHMRTLVHQGRAGDVGPTDLAIAVRKALSLLTVQAQAHNVTIELELDQNLPLVRTNPVQLEQVIVNLVVNAIQSLDGLDSRQRPEKFVRIRGIAASTAALLEVEDNGPGLQGLEDRIFDPFFSSKEAGKGMGLGLSIVHTFVCSWGGEVRVRNNKYGGATFTVQLVRAA